ncbi:hypothetical protein [Enterobacter kobei]|uniref:hypothetical protein n=1 Tax=Enterobacter kobei TaxID=208224 RepID=UPI00298C73E9|nr:hypothetical protein [Enterobacter kobei]
MKTQPATGETYPKSDLFNKAVMCAGLLLVFIQVAPQFTLLYTLKLVTLINLGIQTMKLNGVYKYKRTGILPPGGALSNLTRLNPFKKK